MPNNPLKYADDAGTKLQRHKEQANRLEKFVPLLLCAFVPLPLLTYIVTIYGTLVHNFVAVARCLKAMKDERGD
ncbi:MAG: hypothetical protein WC649_11090 [Desulfobacteria bacterium]